MDRRGWPWKRKSSDKTITNKSVATSDSADVSLASAGSLGEQENCEKVNYIQISADSYAHMNGLEDQVKMLDDQVKILKDQVKELNEKLSAAQSEVIKKDDLVKQHAKVAEEAVSGWEKADEEALALKHQLESVTLLKLTAEDRASHLDDALKECMKQIRNVKEENEKKLNEIILTKTMQWDKIKFELEAKVAELDRGLLQLAAENSALSRSLQERSNMLMKISEEKTKAEGEIELLKEIIQSYEKEINSLKYEVHIVSKELDIRNEEKNMTLRSAEAANKQHLEGVKKIAKLEAECQRLRGLVRKKLPGPAALAQMKLEVENINQDFSEPHLRRTPVKNSRPNLFPLPEFSTENIQNYCKENELLAAHLSEAEGETRMLKEALTSSKDELQASRNMCLTMAGRIKGLEEQILVLDQQRNSKSNLGIAKGVVDEESTADSWPDTSLISELSHQREKNIEKSNKTDKRNHLELMDDFLEMERLACLSSESSGSISISGKNETTDRIISMDSMNAGICQSEQLPVSSLSLNQVSSYGKFAAGELQLDIDKRDFPKLQSRILMILESRTDVDMEKILEDIKRVMEDVEGSLSQHSTRCSSKETQLDDACSRQACPQDIGLVTEGENSKVSDGKSITHREHLTNQDLLTAISQTHEFVLLLGREAIRIEDIYSVGHSLSEKCEDFSAFVDKFLFNKISMVDFILKLSHVLAKVSKLSFSISYKGYKGEVTSGDCVDKVTLLESETVQYDSSNQGFPNGSEQVTDSAFNSDVLQEGNKSPCFGSNFSSCKCSLQELEQLKLDKYNMAMDLDRCTQDLESTKSQLQETEQLLAELKLQLDSRQKSNSLAETQLKCMTESYKSLEMHAQQLKAEVDLLQAKAENLENELLKQKCSHEDALNQCLNLQEQIRRNGSCSTCSSSSVSNLDEKSRQEKEIAAAAEKLAQCQETIYLLGRQLKALHPQTPVSASSHSEKLQIGETIVNDQSILGLSNYWGNVDNAACADVKATGKKSLGRNSSLSGPSEVEANMSINSNNPMVPEKHPHSFRFFSLKGKSGI
ncbi:filament-like plant protein 4 [Malania oleifera]|uniref:filament-like plant protein 4 n=1 Tax=Malania oleifera TaxID=397392 RepID=UPI0025ADBE10|nr:filament-like plant protein 4 [Malania oleifera]XP_057960579.1 filament-like plant protein 4 [Malania oleifera]XP_057960586.1 filament-like plant protein 4 [Malania oleifera]